MKTENENKYQFLDEIRELIAEMKESGYTPKEETERESINKAQVADFYQSTIPFRTKLEELN